jgi:hypothetical protein
LYPGTSVKGKKMIWIKVAILLICAGLWRKGGTKGGKLYRVILLPLILCAYIALKTHLWLWILPIFGLMQAYRIGYGAWDPENDPKPSILASWTHDRSGRGERAIAGFLYGIAPVPLVLAHKFGGLPELGYLLLQVGLGFGLAQVNVWISETLIGAGVASIVFLI